jgi:hypothetical protein
MRRTLAGVLAVGIGAFLAAHAWAGVAEEIELTDLNQFDPVNPPARSFGDGGFSFAWSMTPEAHNVRQDKKVFYSGEPDTTGNFDLSEISAGTFPYYCETHGSPGAQMHGTLKVRPDRMATKRKHGDIQIGVGWADASLPSGDQFDVEYKVNNGDWKRWKKNTSQLDGTFGLNGNPVDVNPNKTYRFRVRSELEEKPNRRSGFSPALKADFT